MHSHDRPCANKQVESLVQKSVIIAIASGRDGMGRLTVAYVML
jgi:hypothetical protein